MALAFVAAMPALALASNDKPFLHGGSFVTIAADGSTLVRGATVTAVSDASITAETSFGSADLSWTVETDSDTEYVGAKGASHARADIATGDSISFSGMLTGALTVAANVVKEWSGEIRAAFTGIVASVDAEADTFVIADTRAGDVTVEVTGDTSFNGTADFSAIDEGDRIAVSGAYDADAKVLTAAKIAINPERPDRDHDRGFGARIKAWLDSAFDLWKN